MWVTETEFSDEAYPKLVQLSKDVQEAVLAVQETQAKLLECVRKFVDHNTDPHAHNLDGVLGDLDDRLIKDFAEKLVAATPEKTGMVKPDNKTTTVNENGELSVKFSVKAEANSLVMRDANGRIQGDIQGNATWADLAEVYHSAEELEVGDVVTVNETSDGDIRKANKDDLVLGVVSEKPGVLLNSKYFGMHLYYPVARVGIIDIKINGSVKKGQGIVIDDNGMARAAKGREKGFARSLETRTESGLVRCLI